MLHSHPKACIWYSSHTNNKQGCPLCGHREMISADEANSARDKAYPRQRPPAMLCSLPLKTYLSKNIHIICINTPKWLRWGSANISSYWKKSLILVLDSIRNFHLCWLRTECMSHLIYSCKSVERYLPPNRKLEMATMLRFKFTWFRRSQGGF